jgi:SAM-dependent methyltransferase
MTNDEALAALETLYTAQPPAKPWTPVLPYDIKARRVAEGQQPDLIVEAFQPTRVLDYGCGAGFLVAFLAELGVDVRGYEPLIPPKVPPYVRHLVSDQKPQAGTARYDLVVCREVLEHVPFRDVRGVVAHLCALSTKFVYVTTRFAQNPAHFLSVDTVDQLDPTHITMMNQDFLRLLFVMEGFVRRPDLEGVLDWQKKGRVLIYERA